MKENIQLPVFGVCYLQVTVPTGCMTKNTGPNPTYEEDRFVPVPIKAGDAIIIHGLVVHKSEPNRSFFGIV
jgi:hypothetical protein